MSLFWRLTEGRVAISAILTILAGLTEGISLVLLIPIVAATSPDQTEQMMQIPVIGEWLSRTSPSLILLLFGFVLMIALQAALTRAKNLYSNRIMLKAADLMRLDLFKKISMAHWAAISTRRTSDINHVLGTDSARMLIAASAGLAVFQAGVMLVIYMTIAAAVSWQMACFAAATGSVLFAALYPIRRRATNFGKDMTEKFQDQNHTVLEFITSIRLAKLFTSEQRHTDAYDGHLRSIRHQALHFQSIATFGSLFFQIGAACIAAIFVWMSIEVFDLDIARIGVLLVIFIRLAPRFNIIQDSSQQFLANSAAYANYNAMNEYFTTHGEIDPDILQSAPLLSQAIHLREMTLQFPGADMPSLDQIEFSIAAGKITAIIGPSGSGKSTLADILLGLTRPDSGYLIIDDAQIDDINRRAWRSSVACVPQDAFLLNDTIAVNLRIAKKDASEKELWECLDKANIGNLVRALPEGLETTAGDRGTRFSGGERQRLALARALLRKPQLLVLDEATSALDWENQNIIAASIEALRDEMTIVTIAHRPSLITFADDVVALEKGRLVARDTYEQMKNDAGSPLAKMLKSDGFQ